MNILDPKFRYTPASKTDIRKTFKRAREQMKEQAEAQAKSANVRPIKKAAK